MENQKNICTNCGKELDDSSIFCPHCGAKQTSVDETSSETIETKTPSSVSKFNDNMKNIVGRYHLIPSDIIAVLGAVITLLGVYVFHFFDVNIPLLGHMSSTLAGSVKFVKQLLGLGESLGGTSSVSGEVSSMIHQLQFFVAAMTLLPIIVVVCTFINKKISKIIGSVLALLVTILYFIFNAKVQSAIPSSADSKYLINSMFGPAGSIIIVGLLIMVGGSCYSLYSFFKKNDEKVNIDFSKITKKQWMISGGIISTSYTIDSLLKSVKFNGFNHYGKVEYDEDIFSTNDENTKLSNGDKVTLTLSNDYIDQESSNGKVLKGAKSKAVEISGLKDTVQPSNLNDLLNQTDSVARNDNKSSSWSTYTVTRQDSYFVGKDITNSWYTDSSDTAGKFSLLTIYKIDEKSDNTTEPTKYKVYGYSGLTLKDNKVDISGLSDENKYSDYLSFNSVQEVLDSLKSHYPGISKMN